MLKIRDDLTPLDHLLRRWSSRGIVRSSGGAGLWSIANALEEMPRADAAVGLRGWIAKRFALAVALRPTMQRDLEGLHDRRQRATRRIEGGLTAGVRGSVAGGGHHRRAGRLSALARGLRLVPSGRIKCSWLRGAASPRPTTPRHRMTRPLLRRHGRFGRQKAAPEHTREGTPEAQERFKKRGLRDILKATAAAASRPAPTGCGFRMKRASATRAGCVTGGGAGKWRACPGTRQIGYQWAYIFSAVRPDTGERRHPGDAERQRQGHGPV